MSDIISEWYETTENVDEMKNWEKSRLKKWESMVTKRFPEKAKILDVGCGLGREAFILADMGFTVTGIDISHEVIKQVKELSRQKGYEIAFSWYDGHVLPYEDNSFDVVVIWAQTFGLLYGDEYKHAFLTECKRTLKNGGLVSFSGHDHAFLMENHQDCMKSGRFYPYANTELYWETFQISDLTKYAQDAGYTVILSENGEIYTPEDGTILHCLCKK